MNLLALDTSGPVAGVAVLKQGELVFEGSAMAKMKHSVNILPMVEEALTRADMSIEDIELYAAVTGPGSFTGVRIGVNLVKGMAHGAGKPCIGVDALEALAASACLPDVLLCPIQDARAGQVYGAAFLQGFPPVRKMENEAASLDVYLQHVMVLAESGRKLLFLGDGIKTFGDAIHKTLGERAILPPYHLSFLRPSSVALLAYECRAHAVDYLHLLPQYLRAPQAERERARKLALEKKQQGEFT